VTSIIETDIVYPHSHVTVSCLKIDIDLANLNRYNDYGLPNF